jgi:hypothetical protein
VLRADRMKSHSELFGSIKARAGDAALTAAAAESAPASRLISAEHVGSTSKWTQVMCDE